MHGIVRILEPVRVRWPLPIAGALAALALTLLPGHQASRRDVAHVELARHHCVGAAVRADDQPRQPVRTLQSIELERRWVFNEASPEAIDETLRTHAEPWEPFMYLLDAQPRMAIAGPAHPHYEQWSYEFGRDQDGGIWLVRATQASPIPAEILLFNREIFLLPAGSSFRGVIER